VAKNSDTKPKRGRRRPTPVPAKVEKKMLVISTDSAGKKEIKHAGFGSIYELIGWIDTEVKTEDIKAAMLVKKE
jgi:hypothetical protein